jgi:hypothetical protein
MHLWRRLPQALTDVVLLLMVIAAGGVVGLSAARLGEWAVASL